MKDKMQKLLALALRGEGGERENAERMLEKLLQKHGMTRDDLIENETPERAWFYFDGRFGRALLLQVLAQVLDSYTAPIYRHPTRRQLGANLTKAQVVEVELRFHALKRDMDKNLDIAYRAFLTANNVYPPTATWDGESKPTGDEDLVWRMAANIEPTTIHNQLENKE